MKKGTNFTPPTAPTMKKVFIFGMLSIASQSATLAVFTLLQCVLLKVLAICFSLEITAYTVLLMVDLHGSIPKDQVE